MNPEEIKRLVTEALIKRRPLKEALIALYLFGSFAKGTSREDSDIDLAFVFDEAFYKKDPFYALQEVELFSYEISRLAGRPVEPVILNNASVVFAFNVLKEAICLYEKGLSERIKYEVLMDNKYQDFAPFIMELRKEKERLLIGRD